MLKNAVKSAVVLFVLAAVLWRAGQPDIAVVNDAQAQFPNLMQQKPASFADLAEKLLPTVVNISTTQALEAGAEGLPQLPQLPPGSPFEDFFREFFDHQQQQQGESPPPGPRPSSLGSGFVIDAEQGYIITNNHVIKDSDEIKVIFQDDETIDAELVGYDDKTDVAVLKIKTKKKLYAASWGNSSKMRVGDWVVAIGNPFGLGGTVTAGIISAQQRNINAGPYDDFIQTDASINRGNSGGPMFNLDGEIIGINTAIFSPSGGSVGIGFAVPSDLVRPVVEQLIKYGKTRRGWMGVRIQQVTEEIAESLGLGKARGALVAGLTPGGPAEKAKIEQGDVILKFNGHDIGEMRHLPRLVAEAEVGATVPVVVWRKGAEVALKVDLGELEQAEESGMLETNAENGGDKVKATEFSELGMSLAALDDNARGVYGVDPAVKGVVITAIDPKSSLGEKDVRVGDVIVEADQQPVRTPDEVKKRLGDAKKKSRSSVLFLINRGGDLRFVAIKVREKTEKKE